MPPLMNTKDRSDHYFELHPLQGTFALTFGCLALVALISIAIVVAFGA